MKLSDFDYDFPRRLIAFKPAKRRGSSRLMVVHRADGKIEHKSFFDLPSYLKKTDIVLLNDTKVLPVSFKVVFANGKGADLLVLKKIDGVTAECLVKPAKKFKKGVKVFFKNGAQAAVLQEYPVKVLRFSCPVDDLLKKEGSMPLPPYIKRETDTADFDAYQTVYAKNEGAVAAPTAGLHFSEEVLGEISKTCAALDFITLHVGYGTFRPVRSEDIAQHRMHSEWFNVSKNTADLISKTRNAGGRILAVGTTTCRALETIAKTVSGERLAVSGSYTDIFIYPPYEFKLTDMLLTNFHLPKTTLLMLTAAFCGYNLMMKAYREAVENEYRLFSYGDAMLII